MPDISSFIVSAKNQENLNSGKVTATKKKRKRKQSSDFQEEVMPTMGSSTRSRGPKAPMGNSSATKPSDVGPAYDVDGVYIVPEGREMRVSYPHKKYQVSTNK